MSRSRRQTLRLRRVAIDTFRENVAYMHRDCEIYRAEGFQALAKIEIRSGRKRVLAVLNVVDNGNILAPDELGLSEQAFDQLNLREGHAVRVAHAEPPASLAAVHRKIAGDPLRYEEFLALTRDIVDNRYSKMEMATFLVACSHSGMSRDEVLSLTRAMVETGERLDWGEPLVADKHCIGGIPGNRTSMLLVPIVAAHGMLIPKTSSRAITSPAGTADTMELLAQVELSPKRLHEIVRRERGCLAWGGAARLAPVDDILISVERPLSMDSPGQMIASILSKKVAAGSTHLLLDIPAGPTAKVRRMQDAVALRKLFEFVGDRMGLHTEVIITDGSQPIGRGDRTVFRAARRHAGAGKRPAGPAGSAPEGPAPGRAGARVRSGHPWRAGLRGGARHPRFRPRAGEDAGHRPGPGGKRSGPRAGTPVSQGACAAGGLRHGH